MNSPCRKSAKGKTSDASRSVPKGIRLNRSGLSLVELIVAIMVLTVGLLGMAAGTGWMIRAVDLAKLETSRAVALQAGVEQVRATPFENIAAGQVSQGAFDVSWTIADQAGSWRLLEFVVVGPGRVQGSVGPRPTISLNAADTLMYRISRP